jgi:hypothetical protein
MPALHSSLGTGLYTHQNCHLWENSSRDGALAIDPHAASIEARYWALLLKAGPIGLTDEDAAKALGLNKITTLIGRRGDLGKQVVWSGKKRRGASGVRCKTWIAVQFAERTA